jgi:hypothetical protein
MAKLNVVIPSVDVEVIVGGVAVKYRKVERSAVAGDIVKYMEDSWDITDGAFYAVFNDEDEDASITDDGGDERYVDVSNHEVYEKVTEAQTSESSVSPKKVNAIVGQRIKIVSAWGTENKYRNGDEFIVTSVRFDGVVFVAEHNRPIDTGEYVIIADEPSAPAKYREVKRKANVGERVKIVAAGYAGTPTTYKNGESFTVTALKGDYGVRINRKWRDSSDIDAWVYKSEYVVLEPIEQTKPTQPDRLKVGEYAKVVNAGGAGNARIGDIAIVTGYWGGLVGTDVRTPDGRQYGMYNERFIRATDAEVTAAKQALERTKAIGEFAEGGYAQVVNATEGNATSRRTEYRGAYVTITKDYGYTGKFTLQATGIDGRYFYCNADALRKITKEEYEAATKPAPKFEVGENVRIIRNQSNWPVGTIVTITKLISDISICATDGTTSYYADVIAIEKLSAEEIDKLAEEAQWAKIGREVGEYKAGDVVRVNNAAGSSLRNGDIGIVAEDTYGEWIRVNTSTVTSGNFQGVEDIELIAPAESLFNVTTAGGERK